MDVEGAGRISAALFTTSAAWCSPTSYSLPSIVNDLTFLLLFFSVVDNLTDSVQSKRRLTAASVVDPNNNNMLKIKCFFM
jgi:hypothetical protein